METRQGVRAPLRGHKNIGVLSNAGPGSPGRSQGCRVGIQCLDIMGTPAVRHLSGVSLAGR